ncbi:MAG: (2Fe-2S) ferredoxin domain-containing protein [Deltaproteobacteria bacterium]|nr:(2Fe-2S) ferredoxin domain-containing protein [Deltaproteobacteria bacterium]
MKQNCFVCLNVDCKIRGSEQLMNELTGKVTTHSLDVEVKSYTCFGGCDQGPNIVIHPQRVWYAGVPNIVIHPQRVWYAGVKPEDLPEIVESLNGGPPVNRLDTIDPSLKEIIFSLLDTGLM